MTRPWYRLTAEEATNGIASAKRAIVAVLDGYGLRCERDLFNLDRMLTTARGRRAIDLSDARARVERELDATIAAICAEAASS